MQSRELLVGDLELSPLLERWLLVQIGIAKRFHERGDQKPLFYRLEDRALSRIERKLNRLEQKERIRESDAFMLKGYISALRKQVSS